MSKFSQSKGKAIEVADELKAFIDKYGYDSYEQNIESLIKKLREEKLYILVCGEIKRGKSSFLTAYLEEEGVFPINVNVATNLVSIASYGERERLSVVVNKDGRDKSIPIRKDEIKEYVTEQGNKNNIKEAKLLTIEIPNEKLKDGFVFVDTPGIGSITPQHSAITFAFLQNADAALFVSDTHAPLTDEEVEFIKKVYEHCKNIVFLLTKIDKSDEYEQLMETNKEKIASALNIPEKEILYVPISNTAKMKYLETNNKRFLDISNYQKLENVLWENILRKRSKMIFLPAIGESIKITSNLRHFIESNLKAMSKENTEYAKDFQNEYEELIRNRKELLERNPEWLEKMSDMLKGVKVEIIEYINYNISQIKKNFDENLEIASYRRDPNKVLFDVQMDLNNVLLECNKQMTARIENVYKELVRITGMDIEYVEVYKKIEAGQDENAKIKKRGNVSKFLNVTRNASFNSAAGTAVGGVVGGIIGVAVDAVTLGMSLGLGTYIGSILGGAIGGLIGAITGGKEAIRNNKDMDKNIISKVVIPIINDTHKTVVTQIGTIIDKSHTVLRDELRSLIRAEKERLETELKGFQDNLKLTKDNIDKKVLDLKNQLNQIAKIEGSLEKLVDEGYEEADPINEEETGNGHKIDIKEDWLD